MESVERAKQVLSVHSSPKRSPYAIEGKNGHVPFSHDSYMKRLFTFVNCPHFTVSRPFKCSAVMAALHGFVLFDSLNGGIECVSCKGRSFQPWYDNVDRESMTSVYSKFLVDAHLATCQWRVLPCLESMQYFDCRFDIRPIYDELIESWKSVQCINATVLAICGWRYKSDQLAECALGCSKCILDPSNYGSEDELLTLHYYYCPWRWGNNDYPSGYANAKKMYQ